MSLSADISTLNAAMQAFTYGQNVVSENIANANTPGYTAQVLNLQSILDFGGVSVAGVGSTRNTFLYSQIDGQLALQGYTQAQLATLNQLAAIFPEVANPAATTGLGAAMTNLATAWQSLAGNPTSTAATTTVLNDMQALAKLFSVDSNQLYTLSQNLDTQIQQAVNQVNSLEDQILSLNQQIVSLGGNQSAQTSTLIDQRQQDAQALVKLTGANVNYATNGAMLVTFNGGTLVDGVQSYHLGTMPSATTPGLLDIGYVSVPGHSAMADVTADITSGTLGGLLYSTNTGVKQAVLALNKMAAGIIQRSNEINMAAENGGGVTVPLFTGTEAADIAVNPVVAANPSDIMATNDPANPGNLAAAQALMNSMNMSTEIETINPASGAGIDATSGGGGNWVNPTLAMSGQTTLFSTTPAAGGTMVINAGGNAININWTTANTLNQIVAMINTQGGGAVSAVLQSDSTGQYLHIFSNAPLSIYDAGGNLGVVLALNGVLTSSAPINNVPTLYAATQVAAYGPAPTFTPLALNSVANTLALFTQPVAPPTVSGVPPTQGSVIVNGNAAAPALWSPSQTIPAILAAIQATAPGGSIDASYNQAAQQVSIINVGPPQYTGAGRLSAANPVSSVNIADLTGNLTQVLNLDPATNASQEFSQLITSLGNESTAVASENSQATSLVNATQALQTSQSGVDLNAQLAQAALYQNAYDAAVRMQYVLENMLNYLITQMGSPNGSSSPIG